MLIYDALNLMGGAVDFAGLPVVMTVLGLDDVETTLRLMWLVIEQERIKRG